MPCLASAGRTAITAASLIAAALPACAACPVAADMEQGVVFGLATGEQEPVRRDGPEGQTVSAFTVGDFVSTVTLAHGVYPLTVTESEKGEVVATPTTYRYATSPLPAPAAGLDVTLDVEREGDKLSRERQRYIFGQPVTWTYGRCAYEMIPVTTIHSEDGQEVSRDELHFLPELGHAYLASYSDGQSTEVYTYVSVEVAR